MPAPALQVDDVLRRGLRRRRRAFARCSPKQDGRPVGYALFYPSYDTEHAARGLYLQDLYVVPEARRQGIGRALMAAVARACQADGGCYLFWNALERNARAAPSTGASARARSPWSRSACSRTRWMSWRRRPRRRSEMPRCTIIRARSP